MLLLLGLCSFLSLGYAKPTTCQPNVNLYNDPKTNNFTALDGTVVDLNQYKGKSSAVSNTIYTIIREAVLSGMTTVHYTTMNELPNTYPDLYIVGFPCNQFYLLEPEHNNEILNTLMHVRPGGGFMLHSNFRLSQKVNVNDVDAIDIYKKIKMACPATTKDFGSKSLLMWDDIRSDDISWNYEKFLIDKAGNVRFRFNPSDWNNGAAAEPYIQQLLNE